MSIVSKLAKSTIIIAVEGDHDKELSKETNAKVRELVINATDEELQEIVDWLKSDKITLKHLKGSRDLYRKAFEKYGVE